MPRETVRGDNPGYQTFEVQVGWQRDCDMQIGISLREPQTSDSPATLVEVLYDCDESSRTEVGANVRKALHLPEYVPARDHGEVQSPGDMSWLTDEDLGHKVIQAVARARGEIKSVWWTPTRYGANNLIRLLRKARDAAYGRDE